MAELQKKAKLSNFHFWILESLLAFIAEVGFLCSRVPNQYFSAFSRFGLTRRPSESTSSPQTAPGCTGCRHRRGSISHSEALILIFALNVRCFKRTLESRGRLSRCMKTKLMTFLTSIVAVRARYARFWSSGTTVERTLNSSSNQRSLAVSFSD